MTDDVRRVLSEEERTRIQAARVRGGTCAGCGRTLVPDEPVWVVPFDVYGDGRAYWRAPVGAECAPPAFRAETDGMEPERCAGCGRGIYYRADRRGRRLALCSKRCSRRYHMVRAREAKERG